MPELLSYLGAGLAVMLALVFLRLFYLLEKFTCGSRIEDVIDEAKYYNSLGLKVLINYALEDVKNAKANLIEIYSKLLDKMDEEGVAGDISIKPTSFVDADDCLCCKRQKFTKALEALLERIVLAKRKRWVWLDEEKTETLEWVDSVIEDVVLNRGHRGLAIRVRAYTKQAKSRVAKFMSWVTDDPMLLSGPRQGILAEDIKIGVCRGTYKEDAELSQEETEKQFIEIMGLCLSHGVEAVCASHTMVKKVIGLCKLKEYSKPEMHMLHGREEIDSVLLPFLRIELIDGTTGLIKEGAVYLIFGPFWQRAKYGLRRLKEGPSLLWKA